MIMIMMRMLMMMLNGNYFDYCIHFDEDENGRVGDGDVSMIVGE